MANIFPLFVSHTPALMRERAAPRRNVFRRLFDAMMESRSRAADRAVARYMGGAGFTDRAERAIEDRFLAKGRRL